MYITNTTYVPSICRSSRNKPTHRYFQEWSMNDYFIDAEGRLVQREQCTFHGIYFVRKEDWYRWKRTRQIQILLRIKLRITMNKYSFLKLVALLNFLIVNDSYSTIHLWR